MFVGGREAERIRATIVVVTMLLMTTIWPGIILSYPTPRDFEDCAASVGGMSAGAERSARALDCGARFAGRRKVGGGYAYYDLWQNRSFDIAGPNPTAGERTRIYADYLHLLASQRREAALAELDRLAFEQPRGEASPDLRRPITKRAKPDPCSIKGSLSCTWTKLKSAVGNAFASTAKQEVEAR